MQIIAVIACIAAAVLGTASVMAHSSTLQSVVGYVADVWVLAWVIVNNAYKREYWTAINRPIRELVLMPLPSGLARVMTVGMIVLVILDTVLRFG
jgi:hypothetical protein